METEYNIGHAREILEPRGSLKNYLCFDERGVWPAIERDPHLRTETEELRWRPARALQHLPGAPEVNGTPLLPNPFNARELAAFMLGGVGALVADFYGAWEDEPDPESLNAIDPDSGARRAVTEVFTAYRLAVEQVGADAQRYRDIHGLKKTVEKYKVSEATYFKTHKTKGKTKGRSAANMVWKSPKISRKVLRLDRNRGCAQIVLSCVQQTERLTTWLTVAGVRQ